MYIHSKQFSAFKPYNKGEAFIAPSTIYLPMNPEYMMMPPYFLERLPSQSDQIDSATPPLLIKKSSVQLEAPQLAEAPAAPRATASPSKKGPKTGKRNDPKKSDKLKSVMEDSNFDGDSFFNEMSTSGGVSGKPSPVLNDRVPTSSMTEAHLAYDVSSYCLPKDADLNEVVSTLLKKQKDDSSIGRDVRRRQRKNKD